MIKSYFDRWFVPLIIFVIGALIYLISLAFPNKYFDQISGFLLLIVSLGLFSSGIRKLILKDYKNGIIQIVSFFISIIVIMFITTFVVMFGPSDDYFADDLKIPNNISISEPINLNVGENRPDTINKMPLENFRLQLYNSFQPGLFEYDIWINSKESGLAYLKAFEITKNIELSFARLKKRSTIRIENTNDSIKRFGTKDIFTIYEGDWGKPYAARFELWFKPDNGGNERKIAEKNYKIEGWQR